MVVCGSSLIQFGISDQITQRLSMSIWVTPVLEAGKSYDPSSLEIKFFSCHNPCPRGQHLFNRFQALLRAERLNRSILHKDVVKVLTRDSTSVTGIGHSAAMHDTCLLPHACCSTKRILLVAQSDLGC